MCKILRTVPGRHSKNKCSLVLFFQHHRICIQHAALLHPELPDIKFFQAFAYVPCAMLGFREITANKLKTSWCSYFREERQIVKKIHNVISDGIKRHKGIKIGLCNRE